MENDSEKNLTNETKVENPNERRPDESVDEFSHRMWIEQGRDTFYGTHLDQDLAHRNFRDNMTEYIGKEDGTQYDLYMLKPEWVGRLDEWGIIDKEENLDRDEDYDYYSR